MNKKTKKQVVRVSIVLITLIFLAFIAYSVTNITVLKKESSSLIQVYGTPGLLLLSILLDLIPQYLSPVVALGAAILLGINTYYATIATIIGSTIGAAIGFTLGRKYLFGAVDILISKESTERLIHLTNKYGKIVVPIAAISPIPYLPVVIGAIKFSTKNFIIYGLIPRALGIAAYAYLFSIF
jgi:uncharacterized membrane protein YdjX (TVP38/TMEM64 family)